MMSRRDDLVLLIQKPEVQQCITMLYHLHQIKAILNTTVSDCGDSLILLQSLLSSFQHSYQHGIEDASLLEFNIFLAEVLRNILILSQNDQTQDKHIFWQKMHARIATLLNGTPHHLGLHYCLSATVATKITFLGGLEPVVFQIQYEDGEAVILRLFRHSVSESNQQACDFLQKNYPYFTGQIFASGDMLGDTYCHYEFSEFFAHGTLADYIKQLHEHKKESCFSPIQQRIFLNHFKQILSMLTTLHQHRVYFPDSKPSNFLFKDDPLKEGSHLVISDLKSLAMLMPNKKTTHDVAYTMDYAAPEVLKMSQEGAAVNPYAQDIYALAMTFLEYLIGTTNQSRIKDYKPQNAFEKIMYDLLIKMLHPHPLFRVEYAYFLNQKIERLESELCDVSQEKIVRSYFVDCGERLFVSPRTILGSMRRDVAVKSRYSLA